MENLTALAYDLRKDVINMICAGKAGHIGGDMSVMDTLVTLYFSQMNISPENMDDPDRDLFVMSKGHSVEALYAVLAKKGFFSIDEVIEKSHKPEGCHNDNHCSRLYIDAAYDKCRKRRRYYYGNTAHAGRTRLCLMRFRSFLSDVLSHLFFS